MAFLFNMFNCRSRRPVQQCATNVPEHLANDRQDRMEDGFVLIGQTSSERNTVTASRNTDRPPPYDSQMSLPSYSEACHMESSNSFHSDLRRSQSFPETGRGQVNQSGLQSAQSSCINPPDWFEGNCSSNQLDSSIFAGRQEHSALEDVPFTVPSHYAPHLSVHTMDIPYFTLQNMNQYTYDFSTERQVLKDYRYENL